MIIRSEVAHNLSAGDTVQKRLQSVWAHIKSPVTARSMVLALLLGVIAYTIIHDYLENRRSDARHAEIIGNQQRAEVFRGQIKEQAELTSLALDRLELTLKESERLSRSIKDVADILVLERQARQKEHSGIERAVRRRSQVVRDRGCYELRRRVENKGAAEVVIFDLVRKAKCN